MCDLCLGPYWTAGWLWEEERDGSIRSALGRCRLMVYTVQYIDYDYRWQSFPALSRPFKGSRVDG